MRITRAFVVVAAMVLPALSAPATATAAEQLPMTGQIAFASDRGGDSEIYLVDADGAHLVNLTQNPAQDTDPVWSPDGRDLAFVSDRDGEPALYVLSVATGAIHNLTNGVVEPSEPRWIADAVHGELSVAPSGEISPDGQHIAYAVEGELWLAASDGTGAELLFSAAAPGRVGSISWAPNGSSIAFSVATGSPATGSIVFYQVGLGGSPAVQLDEVGRQFRSGGPFWAPGSDRLAIVEGGISHMNASLVGPGGPASPVRLSGLFDEGTCTAHPSWSTDGTQVVFEAYLEGCPLVALPPMPPSDVYVANRDGSGLLHLGPGNDPAWRPAPYDVGLVDPTTGVWHLNGLAPFYFGDPGDVPFMGDWDGDGIDTPGLYRQSDGFVYLRNSNTQGVADIRFFFGNPGDVPLPGDFDGDGFDTVSIYRPATGQVFVIDELGADEGGLGAADYSFYFGDPGDVPFVGDFDGDGVDTVGLHRDSSGFVYLRNSNTQGEADIAFFYGDPEDHLVACDWNRTGIDSVGVYRPASTTFYLRFSNSAGNADGAFVSGNPAWAPVCGLAE